MAVTQSFGARLRERGVRATDIAAAAASVAHMRLRLDDEEHIRYVFCDWERDCGVRSNQEAQVNALQDRTFKRTVDAAERELRRASETGGIRLALASSNFARKVPLADRGWSKLTAKPGKSSGQAVRFDRMAQPERWTMTKNREHVRDPALRAYRALHAMNEAGLGRHVVVLFKLYGPRDPAADYLRFSDWAPIAHMTPAAREIGDRATKHLRRDIAERFAGAITTRAHGAEATRMAIIDRALLAEPAVGERPHALPLLDTSGVAAAHVRLAAIDQAEAMAGHLGEWTAKRAAGERATIEPREALDVHLRKIDPSEREALEDKVGIQAAVLLGRAATAYYTVRTEIER
jgi:hypothetical protein